MDGRTRSNSTRPTAARPVAISHSIANANPLLPTAAPLVNPGSWSCPQRRPAGFVFRSAALGHDALEAELAGMFKHLHGIELDVLADLQAGVRALEEANERTLAHLDW